MKDTGIKPDNIKYLHLNKGPARFTAIRNCHALMKGFFFNHKTRIHSYSIFEHYYLGINEQLTKNLLCIIDTNRRDLAVQKISAQGKLIGKSKTYVIGEELFALLNKDYILIGNGLKKLKRISEFKFVKKKSLNLYLKTKGFVENILAESNFESVNIFRPSHLLGKRDKKIDFLTRIFELITNFSGLFLIGPFKKYKNIDANKLSLAMIKFSLFDNKGLKKLEFKDF